MRVVDVLLVFELANDLFEDVFEGHDTQDFAIFIDHHAQPALLLVKVQQLQLQRGAFRDEVGFVTNGQQCLFGQAGVGQHVLDVAGVEDGFDLVDVVVKHRQARTRGLAQLFDQFLDRVVEVQALDFAARDQDVVDRDVVQRMDAGQ